MAKGFTLLEMLTVLLIISSMMLLALPVWQQGSDQAILEKEQRKLYLFLRYIQARVENSNEIWLLIVNRDQLQQRWCITAQIKNEQICDCFSPQSCSSQLSAQFYYPSYAGKTMLISKSYYPKEITRLNGIRNTISTACMVLQAGERRTLFSFFNIGSLKLKNNQALSACVNDET
ncbi:type II secretion system protein [Necropsobacter rosorum]|uniref:prepilin-type N-terminal cleavage/methylation domain-containing protein n=1 Tax=Necropsobacter rosorum TaxID=908285 RepID=UPI000509A63A